MGRGKREEGCDQPYIGKKMEIQIYQKKCKCIHQVKYSKKSGSQRVAGLHTREKQSRQSVCRHCACEQGHVANFGCIAGAGFLTDCSSHGIFPSPFLGGVGKLFTVCLIDLRDLWYKRVVCTHQEPRGRSATWHIRCAEKKTSHLLSSLVPGPRNTCGLVTEFAHHQRSSQHTMSRLTGVGVRQQGRQ